MGDPLLRVYLEMKALGSSLSDFPCWRKRVKLLYMAGEGGVVFVEDLHDSFVWWVNAFCPNKRPSDNTVRLLMIIAFASGCHVLAAKTKRAGTAKMLEKLGFQQILKGLYGIRRQAKGG